MAVDLLFQGNERALTVFYRPENEKVGPSKDYELEVYTVDGGVTTVRIGPAYLDYFFAFIVNSETGIVSINNPVVTVDGRKMDIVEAWRKFAAHDKRFILTETSSKDAAKPETVNAE